jgi:putative cardiolipin synthase
MISITRFAALPEQVERTPSSAFDRPETTTAGRIFLPTMAKHPGQSGFAIMPSGATAFRARNAMIRIAEKTLDAQYFSWESDQAGHVLIHQLLEAADRGVRVRLLLDDVNTDGRDLGIASLDAYPNIEVRLFNPFVHRGSIVWGFLTDLSRVNHRMHNKALIMDSAFAVVGGRNIGDPYFGLSPKYNFRDLDLFAAGPVVQAIAKSFDVYWNSKWAYPVSAVTKNNPSVEDTAARRQELREWAEENEMDFPYAMDRTDEEIRQGLGEIEEQLVWADAEVLFDDPERKVGTTTGYQGIAPRLSEILEQLNDEVLFEAAYFIPREEGIQTANRLRDRGVRVRILTNSMATNDVAGAFVGYRRYRKSLLEHGVDLYEIRPKTGTQREFWSFLASDSTATLHSKVVVFDRKMVFIGSFNLDPRSIEINTEIGLLIDSPELAKRVIEFMDTGIDPGNSYHLELEKSGARDRGKITWVSRENAKEVRAGRDPDTGFRRPVSAWFISLLHSLFPIEDHL